MAKKLLKPKRGKVENLSKLAVEDGALVFAYDTKATTSTVLVDIGDTRYDLAAGAAKKANNADALGGSSLQDIVDKINNSTGDGTAFTGLDTATNNKIKLTRANGGTVEKTINNVSNASTANYSKVSGKIGTGTVGSSTKPVYINAGIPAAVSSIPSTFVTAQQINGVNLNTLRTPGMYWAGGSNTNTNKPTGIDAFGLEVLQSAAGWYTQICYASDDQEKQFVRYYNSGTSSWSDWIEQNRLNTKTQSGYAPAPNAANKVYRTDASGNPGWGTLNDSSIGKLASTVTLGDGNGAMIDQNGATYRQRINIFDNAIANDAVFSFQQSTDAGKTYKDLFVINDNSTVVASTFQGALKGTADYSKNSGALGGSSLQNIVDKINNSTGDGTAFTGLDTTTNNKVKLTRANGDTVEKAINNVSNASTANYAKNSDKLDGYHESSFLRYRETANNTSADSLWNQIGIKEFHNCYPENLDGVYNYGEVVSLPGVYTRFDIWVNHQSSNGKTNGLQYRSGWEDDKKPWRMLLDSGNFSQYAANKNAYNSALVSNATITLGRSDGSTGTTLTVNNVAHATNADLAKNSNALGGSSLKNITDRIDSSIAANDAMHYMGTLGATAQKPTITALPTTARIGDAYKVITAGTYSSIAAEVGDLFIYSGSWTLIPSGDDGNVYVGDSKSSKFAAKSNNIVVAIGDQKVASAANVTANAGTISALQSTMTQLKANQGTVTTLNGNKATFSTVNGYLNGNADSATRLKSQGKLTTALSGTMMDTQKGLWMTEAYATTNANPYTYGNVLHLSGANATGQNEIFFGWQSGGSVMPGVFVRSHRDMVGSADDTWSAWTKLISGADALQTSASAISSTNNYFTAGATTAYVAAKTASAVGNYLPLSGGTLTGDLTVNTKITINGRGLQLNRKKGSRHGEINWWDPSYVTWINYMSDRTAGTAPTGGTPSTYGSVTSWAQRSLIENASGYGWIWESAANTAVASSVTPTPIMSLSSKEGNLTIRGNIAPGGQIVKGGTSVSWLDGHKGTGVLINQNTYTGYNPLFRVKTEGGAWTFGPYSSNVLYLNYATDAIINGTQNTSTKQITINPSGDVDGLGKVTASTVKAYLNGVASTAIVAAYPQGFESRTTSATWGNTTGTFITGWHTSSGGDVAFMNDNPSNGKVSMKLDGYFYQNEGSKRVLDTDDAANYVKKSGDTMAGTLTLKTGSQKGIKLGSAWLTAANDKNGEFVLQGGHLRFGSSDWDYNQWAGLKYDAGKKSIYLGLADNAIFTANSAQSGGSIFTPGVNNIYVGASTATKVLTSANIGDYASGKTAFTELDTTTNNVIKLTRANGATVQKTINNVAKASTADRLTMEAATADAARNVWFSDSDVRNKVVYNDNFKYNPVKNSLTTNITGEAASANYAKGGESESNYQLNSTQLHQTIDLTGSTYDQNTWYPVVGSSLPYRGYSRIICYVQLNSGTKPSWSSHNGGFTCNFDILVKASGWGTTGAESIILDNSYNWCKSGEPNPLGYQQLTNSSCPVIWMRGGGKYFIRSSEKFTWEVKTSSYTISSQTITPQTSYPGLSLNRSTIYANINGSVASAGSATNASTADYAKNAGKLGGIEASKYAKKEDIPVIPSNLDVANRLQSYAAGGNISNSLFYRYGVLSSSWSNFPVSSLPSTGIGANFQGKNTGVLHIAAGSSYHDLAFTAGAKDNQGILYAGTGRNPAYILDTENYKTKGNVFNSLTANTSFTAKVNVTIDGGSY